jgi:hypothetical protein
MADFVVLLHTQAKAHLARTSHGAALCGAKSTSGPDPDHWQNGGDRASFEKHLPERICARCRKAELA